MTNIVIKLRCHARIQQSLPRRKLTAQTVEQHTDVQSRVQYHSAIQAAYYELVLENINQRS